MAGAWSKFSSIFFQDEEEDSLNQEEMDELAKGAKKDVWQEPDVQKARRPQVMAIPTASEAKKSYEMVLVKAKAYDDLQSIARNIKEQKVVIVNFEDMDKETAQRMVDFLSGAVFALDGEPKKVSGSTFLFSSSQVDLAGQIMDPEVQAFCGADGGQNGMGGGFAPWRR